MGGRGKTFMTHTNTHMWEAVRGDNGSWAGRGRAERWEGNTWGEVGVEGGRGGEVGRRQSCGRVTASIYI